MRGLQISLTALCGLFLLLGLFDLHPWLPFASVAFGSYFAVQSAIDSLRSRSLDVNFLMVLAAIGAVAIGRPLEAAALLFLFSLSSTLESLALARTKSAIEGLIKLRPEEALRVTADGEQKVKVNDLKVGDSVRVLPFDQVPVDGVILQGESSIDQSAMTGESEPVGKVVGDGVLAGTQNLDRMLIVQVTVQPGDTTLEKVVELVRDAQENKASGERISTWFGQTYTVVVVAIFLASLGIRLALGRPDALYESLVLLVALSPCALVISTPASTLSALAWSARKGILVRGGQYIEEMGRIDTMAMDKTGTLTRGKPVLTEICVCSPVRAGATCVERELCWHGGADMSSEAMELLRVAASAEQYSSHPLATAIVDAARSFGIDVPEADEHRAVPGFGVTATVDGKPAKIGQPAFFEDLPADFDQHANELREKGMTVAILEFEGRYAALGLADSVRPEAKSAVEDLRSIGIRRVAMLTGDTKETAKRIAAEVEIDEVHAGLLPDTKADIVEQMVAEGARVAMVGDGINDAPCLAKAHVGIAMGGLGSDIALNAADIVLMHDKLERLPQLVRLGRRTNRVVGANLFFAGGVIGALTLFSLIGQLPLWMAVLGHEGSTVLVILNGLRLLSGPGRQG